MTYTLQSLHYIIRHPKYLPHSSWTPPISTRVRATRRGQLQVRMSLSSKGAVTRPPVTFFEQLGILKSEDGHRRYARALLQANISEQERTLLANNFQNWKRSKSLIYWERLKTKKVAEKSAWRAAGNMIRGSEPFVENIIAENAKEQSQHSAVPSDTPLTSTTQRPVSSIRRPISNEDGEDTTESQSSSATAPNKKRQRHEFPEPQKQPQKRNRQPQEQGKERDALSPYFFDFATVTPSELVIDDINIGNRFRHLQEEVSPIVNDLTMAITLELLPFFM